MCEFVSQLPYSGWFVGLSGLTLIITNSGLTLVLLC
jgi:hypothetical protein